MREKDSDFSDALESFLCFEDYDQVPGFVISQTAYAIRKTLAKAIKDAGHELTPQEFAILNRLATQPMLNQRQLAELTYKDRPAVTRMLNHLIDKGFVEKQTCDNDRRAYRVRLTKTGKALRARVVPLAQEMLRNALQDIKARDLELTLKTLRRIAANLEGTTG